MHLHIHNTHNDNIELIARIGRLERVIEDLVDAVDNLSDERPPSGALVRAVGDVKRGANANDMLIPDKSL